MAEETPSPPVDEDSEETLNLEELTKEFHITEDQPRPMFYQLLLSFALVLGPIMTALSFVFTKLGGSLRPILLPIFITITVIYFAIAIYQAWKKSKQFE